MEASKIYTGDNTLAINGIVLHRMDGTKYELDAGYTGIALNVDTPWATQAMLNGIWENVEWHTYQPYTLAQAVLDPKLEIGDAISYKGINERIYTMSIRFGRRIVATIGAPDWNECPHEYQADKPSGSGSSGSAGKSRNDSETLRHAQQSLIADIGDVQAGLECIADADDIAGWKRASTSMFAQIQGDYVKKAGLSAEVVSTTVNGVTKMKSLATLLADQITLEGSVTIEGGNLKLKSGNLIISSGGQITVDNIDFRDTNAIYIQNWGYFKPTNITFANGAGYVLAR